MESMKLRFSSFSVKALVLLSVQTVNAQEKLNHVQVIGTHNSYKTAIDKPVMDTLMSFNPKWGVRFDYSHEPIDVQLNLGLANLEIDIAVDRKGGKFSKPALYELFKDQVPPYNQDGEMDKPGLKVLHMQDLDFRSHCGTLSTCLQILRKWSDEHPQHHPVFITMNAKTGPVNHLPTVADEFEKEDYQELNSLIWRELGPGKLLIPKDVQGNFPTLEAAILKKGWPTINSVRGKFIFVLDETGAKRSTYLNSGSEVQVMFTDSPEGDPNAAILIKNDPKKQKEEIKSLVKKGYIIRTRADADTFEARNEDYSRFQAACESGAQIITTDYYRESTHFPSSYKIIFPEGKYVRVNPLLKK